MERDRLAPLSQSVPTIVPSKSVQVGRVEISRIPDRRWVRSQQEIRRESILSLASTIIVKGTRVIFYRLSDVLTTLFILLPLTVGFWRGVWQLMDHYCKEYDLDPWLSMLIGNLIPLFFYYFQEPLKQHIHPTKMNYTCFYVITRFLLLLHSFASVNQWRGLWVFLDTQTGFGWESQVVSLVVGVLLLIQLKIFCNSLAVPLFVGVDEADSSIHDCPVRYATPPSKNKFKYFLDCVYSIVVVQSLVVSAWRGLWNLVTLYLYPGDELISAVLTMAIGNAVVILLCVLQPNYYKFMTNFKGLTRLAVFDFVTMFGFIGSVFTWKGTWDLCNIFVQFETPLLSEWVTATIGGAGALLLGCISTVVIRGVTIDGVDSTDSSSEWPLSYVSLLQKKHHNVPFPEPWVCRCCFTSQKLVKPNVSYTGANIRSQAVPRLTNSKLFTPVNDQEGTPLETIKVYQDCTKR